MNLSGSQKRRILLLYISKVSGHRQATIAIQRALRKLDPNVEAPSINGFGYTYPFLEKVVNSAYMAVIRRAPHIWDSMYDNPKLVKRSQFIQNFLHKASHKKIAQLFKDYQPDTVVCTQAFPCGMVADYKISHSLDVTLVAVLTDFAPHSFWIHEGIDYYIVPAAELKDRFVKKGVPPDKIKVYGIPIRAKFAVQLDKNPIREKLGLRADLPTLLLMGGGQGLGPIKEAVTSLLRVPTDLQMIVIAGTNTELLKWLQDTARTSPKKLISYEYANNVDELMEMATLIITKPGGMTTSEALAKGLPMAIINPLPGQEMRNTDFLLNKGIAIRIDGTEDIGEEIDLLLRSPERLSAMRRAASDHGKPHAASDVASLILQNAEDSEDEGVEEEPSVVSEA
ncbi:MAG: glycosyltransferase [Candidatus Omnitrophota bacterium]|nr:glycosyltransferase [Candidatus Omnitrophota bacterium]MDZ4241303.1 glycosyltransferase [Candidatus Omnitrophota bacterium]